jgi:hypothetical protein
MQEDDPEFREEAAPDRAAGMGSTAEIDLHALAAKVYALLKQEARIECERVGREPRRYR